jgi:hypothetical protein
MSQQKLALVLALALGSCTSASREYTGGGHRDLSGPYNGSDDLAGMSTSDDASMMSIGDGGGAAYADLSVNGDASGCTAGQSGLPCATGLPAQAGCGPVEICGNGLDDDCDGYVDGYPPSVNNSCSCTPGAVQKCFLGPPGKRGVGACTDGMQTCQGSAEFGTWGPCMGSIGPSPETCDNLDNDCNGCADDGLCCNAVLDCPAPGDPRIAPIAPYSDLALKGELFFSGTATKWTWAVSGGPCDQLFASAAFTPKATPPVQSFTLTNANTKDATVHFTLSGDYTVTMTVVDSSGATSTCKWVQHVQGPGVRFELCWDHQGSKGQGGADLDLHVHRSASTKAWSDDDDDCFFDNCTALDYLIGGLNWGYAQTPLANCKGAKNGTEWMSTPGMDCYSPRLDNDNISTPGIAENTNIDTPKAGDSFRSMVHYYSNGFNVEEHPIVNIYCGGNLLATYGQAPNQLSGFKTGAGDPTKGQMWRVADVAPMVDATGLTTGCTITAIHPPSTTSGFYITTNDTTY